MKRTRDIERMVRELRQPAPAETHSRVLGHLLDVWKQRQRSKPAAPQPHIGRNVMKNPITKLAAAAVVILALVLGLSEFFSTSGTSGVAWGQVLERTQQIPAVVFDMTVEITYAPDNKLVLPSRNYVAGDYGTRSDIVLGGDVAIRKLRLPGRREAYHIRLDRKEYVRIELTDEQAAQSGDTDDPRTWLAMILSGDYTKLGRTTINGVTAEGIECHPGELVGETGTLWLWVDVETNLPVLIEGEMMGMEGGQMRPHKYVMENFEWDAQLDESLFEPNIPDDFTRM